MLSEIAGPVDQPFHPETINACLERAKRDNPDMVAIKQYDATCNLVGALTFAELENAVARLAGALAKDFGQGDNIGLWGNNSIGWIVYQLAILRLGGVVVTLDPALRAADLNHTLSTSQAVGVVMDRAYRGNELPAILTEIESKLPHLRRKIYIDEWETAAAQSEPLPPAPVTPDDNAIIVFTSGTTGDPKGVILHHGGCIGNALDSIKRTGLSPDSTLLNPLPAYSVGGAVCITLGALASQRPQIVINHFDPSVVIELSGKERFGWMPLVPAMLMPLIGHADFGAADFSALEAVWMGGTIITPEHVALARSNLGVKVVTIYGQTESSGVHSMNLPDASDDAVSRTVGIPLSHGRIRIANLETGAPMPRGEIGEIREKSPYMTHGYFQNEEATQNLFDEDGFLRTGDLGLIDEDGLLRITGRLKEMIIRGGRNIYPREIEDILNSFDGVAECAVIGVPHERWGEEIAVALRSQSPEALDLEAARAYLTERLAAYKVPKLWRQVEDFPRGGQGKIRKIDMLDMFEDSSDT